MTRRIIEVPVRHYPQPLHRDLYSRATAPARGWLGRLAMIFKGE